MTSAITRPTTPTLDIDPISGACGAEIRGVDLAHLDDEAWAQIHAAWLEYVVVFFPDQHVTPEAHIALARRLGDPEIHPFIPKRPGFDEIVQLGGGIAADVWHTDVTFTERPPLASILHLTTLPSRGGDTIFTNQYLVYERLSAPVRDMIETLTAVHTADSYGHPEVRVEHPVVRIHPETGRRSLFVNRQFTSHIPQLSRAESDAVLDMLCRFSEQPTFQCRYRWTPGAVAMWDNRCTQHYAVNDYDEPRAGERITVLGADRPVGPPPRYEHFDNPHGSAFEATRGQTPVRTGVDAYADIHEEAPGGPD